MSLHYTHSALPSDYDAYTLLPTNKRHRPVMDPSHPPLPSAKRPRRISTPSSAISAVTVNSDTDDVVPVASIPVSAPSHSLHPPSPTLHLPSPPFPTSSTSPSLSIALPLTPSSPTRSTLSPSPSHPSFTTRRHNLSTNISTPSQPDLIRPRSPGLRADSEIDIDAANSFCTGNTGHVQWTNDLLVHVLAADVEDLCVASSHLRAPSAASSELHVFFSQHKQPFDLDFYIRRLIQFANCSSAAFILMLIYLDRVQEQCPTLLLTEMNCHRLLCTALVLAIKYLDDEVFSNAYYARVGGVTGDEMNDLELKMLAILKWDLSVKPDTFALYEEGLIRSASLVSDSRSTDNSL